MELEGERQAAYVQDAAITLSRWQEWRGGVTAMLPLLVGVIPFGLIYGVLAVPAGLPVTLAQAMSTIVFAGSAQFITTQLLHDHAPFVVIFLTAAIVNLRHVLYSASMAAHLNALNLGWKALLAYLLTDEAYAVAITRYRGSHNRSLRFAQWYFFGAGLSLWVAWQSSTAIGVFVGAQLPAAWSLDFTLPLTFIAITVPTLRDRASGATALAAGGMALLALTMPLKLGLLIAILTAIGVGYGVEEMEKRSHVKNMIIQKRSK